MPDKKNTIGRFEIVEKIGEGPIGAVYKALDPVIRRTVAIKVIKLYALEETATFAEVFEKIYRVVRTSTSLNHPNICIIYDLSEEKKIPYITMEYIEGHDLDSLLRRKHQFKRPELINILQQICDALDFAHRKNVIHQDLKSTNILLTPERNVKITDFGIAGLDEIAAAQTKKLLSIPYYISPEQALGEKVSPASDLFSLGVIIYHLLCGQLPFPGTTAANTIMMIARDHPAPPENLGRSGITKDDWNSFFSIALAKSPGQRFRSAREMLEAISAILPQSDQTYFPYEVEGVLRDSTGKIQRTFLDEAAPTVLVDPSKILEEAAAPQALPKEAPTITAPGFTERTEPNLIVPPQVNKPQPQSTEMMTEADLLEQRKTLMVEPPPAPTIAPAAPATKQITVPEMSTPPQINQEVRPHPSVTPVSTSAPTELVAMPSGVVTQKGAPIPSNESSQDHSSRAAKTELIAPFPTLPPVPEPPTQRPYAAPSGDGAQPVARKAVTPPNLKRYFLLAVLTALLIVVAAAIFFLRQGIETGPLTGPATTTKRHSAAREGLSQGSTPGASTSVPAVGKITITSDPAGATVFLQDQEKGVTPLEIPDVEFGKYSLRLQLKGYQDLSQDVELTAENPAATIPLTLEKAVPVIGTLVVESTPPGAFIVIGGRVIGATPKTLTNIRAGKYKVILRKEGFEEFTGSVRVIQDKSATLHAPLVEIPKPPPPLVEVHPKAPEMRPGQLVALGPEVNPPKALKRGFSRYPQVAKARKIAGNVSMSVLISETGKVLDVKVTKSAHPLLDEAAVSALKQWVYQPATKNGVPVKVWIPVTMSFQIKQ